MYIYLRRYTTVSVYGFIFKRHGNDRVVADFEIIIYQRPSRRHFSHLWPLATGTNILARSHIMRTSNTTPKSKHVTTVQKIIVINYVPILVIGIVLKQLKNNTFRIEIRHRIYYYWKTFSCAIDKSVGFDILLQNGQQWLRRIKIVIWYLF